MNSNFSTRIDMTGQRIFKWTVLGFSHTVSRQAYWTCKCECGTIVPVSGKSLRKGLSKSCGCYRVESGSITHRVNHETIDGVECKRCRTCREWISLNNFSKSKDRWDGLSKDCRNCLSDERKTTRISMREYMRNWANNRYKNNINYKVKSCIQARIRSAIKNNYKAARTTELLGCSIEYLKVHLESQFQFGMSWDNYGDWHIDHKVPCAKFDLSSPEQQMACFHYSNLQPLWMIDNVRKGDKIL